MRHRSNYLKPISHASYSKTCLVFGMAPMFYCENEQAQIYQHSPRVSMDGRVNRGDGSGRRLSQCQAAAARKALRHSIPRALYRCSRSGWSYPSGDLWRTPPKEIYRRDGRMRYRLLRLRQRRLARHSRALRNPHGGASSRALPIGSTRTIATAHSPMLQRRPDLFAPDGPAASPSATTTTTALKTSSLPTTDRMSSIAIMAMAPSPTSPRRPAFCTRERFAGARAARSSTMTATGISTCSSRTTSI